MSAVPNWARVGAKVVYVPYRGPDRSPPRCRIKCVAGDVYTISSVELCDGYVCVTLDEIPEWQDGQLVMWRIRNFRPVVEDNSDNEIEAQIFRNRKQKQPHSAPRKVSA